MASSSRSPVGPCSCIIKYFELQEKFERKYGERTIVWIQIGDFYEMFEYDPSCCLEEKYKISKYRPGYIYDKPIGQTTNVALILDDMTRTMQNSNMPFSVDNPYKAGFPIHKYDVKRKTLLYHDYVIVRIDQVNSNHLHKYRSEEIFYVNKNSEPRRIVEISSRATTLDMELPPTVTNNIMSIYIEYQKGQRVFEDSILTCGVSCIDVTTGINLVSELHGKDYNRGAAIQEITRFMLAQQPREIIVNVSNLPTKYVGNKTEIHGPYARFLIELFELDKCVNFVILINQVKPEYSKLSYQGQFFNKVFFSSGTPQLTGPDIGTIGISKNINSSQSGINSTMTFNFGMKQGCDFTRPPSDNNKPTKSISSSILNSQSGSSNIKGITDRSEKIKLLHSNSMVLNKLGLENMSYGRISYMLLLQYCYEHSPYLIRRVKPPDTNWIDAKRHLTLTNNAIEQLDIAPEHGFNYRRNGNMHSLFDVLNFTKTRMGYRRLRNRLFNPLLDPIELNKSYQMIDDMSNTILNQIRIILKGIPDIDIYYRKIMLGTLKPRELTILYNAYTKIINLYGIIYSCSSNVLKTMLFNGTEADEYNLFLRDVFNTFDLDKLKDCKIVSNNGTKAMDFLHTPIKIGAKPELDQLIRSITRYEQLLEAVCSHLNTFLTRSRGAKIDYHRKSKDKNKRNKIVGIDILTTQAKARTIQRNLASIDRTICGDIQIETFHSQRRITSDKINEFITGMETCKNQLRVKVLKVYHDLIERVSNLNFYEAISDMVATLDFIQSGRTAVNKFKYYRPTIIDDKCEESYFRVTKLRHPVIERIIDQPYITNDVQLGIGPDSESNKLIEAKRGLLVYGANSTGKTTLARAVALAIIMAQAGLYTAGNLTYRIFNKIFTRIGGNDDSNKGRSSFVVELCEIRIPVSEADGRSLIFGDEPCRGTERFSGVGIAAETIKHLLNRKACFIMATHLHDMLQLKSFQPLKEQLQISHLNMYHDPKIGDLVNNRKLCPGAGPTIYGIEVAKSLGFPNEFIRGAMKFRAEAIKISTEILSTTKSRYNSNVYTDSCEQCGSQIDLHTHHIAPQKLADKEGFIGNMPKNIAGNLITLCQSCHHKTHHQNLKLERLETVSGTALITNSN